MTDYQLMYAQDVTSQLMAELFADLDGMNQPIVEPHSVRAEKMCLASLLRDNRQFDRVNAVLTGPGSFFISTHQDIWRVFVDCFATDSRRAYEDIARAIDWPLIRGRLGERWHDGHEALRDELKVVVVGDQNAHVFGEVVENLSRRRETAVHLRRALAEIENPHHDIERVQKPMATAVQLLNGKADIERAAAPMGSVAEMRSERQMRLEGGKKPISTGCDVLDAVLGGGFRESQSYAIAGLTGHGKTTLVLQAVRGFWKAQTQTTRDGLTGGIVNVHTKEMTRPQTIARLMALGKANISERWALDPSLIRNEEMRNIMDIKVERELTGLMNSRVHIYAGGEMFDIEEIESCARLRRAQYGYDLPMLVVVDLIQYVSVNARRNLMGAELFQHVAGRLASLANELKCSVAILTQFTEPRNARSMPVPIQSPNMAYGGASLEHAVSDFVIYHRPWLYNNSRINDTLKWSELTVIELAKGRYTDKQHVIARSDLATKTFDWWDGFVPDDCPNNGTLRLVKEDWDRLKAKQGGDQ